MKLTRISPILYTKQLKETVNFYTQTLGFECESIDEEYGWASLQRDNVCIMFSKPNQHTHFNKPILTGSIYLYPDNVDTAWQSLKDKVDICYPIENFEYGMREFGITDNNGYTIQFGQEIHQND